jgi:HAMP domain-containing protein
VAELLAADPAGPGPVAVDEPDELLIQVLDSGGRVVAASPGARARPRWPGSGPASRPASPSRTRPRSRPTASSWPWPSGPTPPWGGGRCWWRGPPRRSARRPPRSAGCSPVGLPLLLAVVAAITWVVVGRALAPVDAIRAEVDAISAAALHRRVHAPPADDEIGRLARTMNHMLGRLEQAQGRQRRLVSDASHELRSPVAAVRQHAEVALAHPDRTTTAELAATVLAEDLRLQRLAEDLLLLTRAAGHTLALRRRPVDLDDLVFDEARRLREGTGLRVDTGAVSAGRSTGTPPGCGGCCATWATTPLATPPGG